MNKLIMAMLGVLLIASCKKGNPGARAEFGRSKALEDPVKLAAADSARYANLIVYNPAPDPEAPAFRIVATPVMKVGGRNDSKLNQELWDVYDAGITEKGQLIAVMDRGREIRVFDAKNQFVGTVGREGPGPGEFSRVDDIAILPGDTVVARDWRARFHVYDPAFRFVRTAKLESDPKPGGDYRSTEVVCCLRDGSLLVRSNASFKERHWPEGRAQREWRIAPATSESASSAQALSLEDSDPHGFVITEWSPTGGMLMSEMPTIPFSRAAFVVPASDEIVHATGDYYEYRVYARSGHLARVVRAAAPVLQVEESEMQLAKERFVSTSNKDRRKLFEAAWEKLELPATLPAFSRILADEEGNVWVRNYSPPRLLPDSLQGRAGTTGEWWARFDREGKLLGTIRIPDWHSVIGFSRGHVILRNIEPVDGFTWVTVHRMERTDGR